MQRVWNIQVLRNELLVEKLRVREAARLLQEGQGDAALAVLTRDVGELVQDMARADPARNLTRVGADEEETSPRAQPPRSH